MRLFGINIVSEKKLRSFLEAEYQRGWDFGRSDLMEKLPPKTPNYNICDRCHEPTRSYGVADTGVCGQCGSVGECFDYGLLKLYDALGFEDEFIWKNVPRLRTHEYRNFSTLKAITAR